MADTRAGFWLLLVIELVAVAIVTITVIAGNDADKDFFSLFQGTLWVVSILLPVLGILLVTSEWSQRTGLTTFALVPERGRVITAKIFAAIVLALAATVACLITAAAGNLVAGGSWDLSLGAIGRGALFETLGAARRRRLRARVHELGPGDRSLLHPPHRLEHPRPEHPRDREAGQVAGHEPDGPAAGRRRDDRHRLGAARHLDGPVAGRRDADRLVEAA